jgi:hypothetical protein
MPKQKVTLTLKTSAEITATAACGGPCCAFQPVDRQQRGTPKTGIEPFCFRLIRLFPFDSAHLHANSGKDAVAIAVEKLVPGSSHTAWSVSDLRPC